MATARNISQAITGSELITEEDIKKNRRDTLADLAQKRALAEMANRLGIDKSFYSNEYERLGTLADQADNRVTFGGNQSELTIDPIELTIPRRVPESHPRFMPQPRYQAGFDGQMMQQQASIPNQPKTTGLSLLGENATSLANDIVNRRRDRISSERQLANQSPASMPTSSANNPVMTGILQALSAPQSVTGSPSGYQPEMLRAQSEQPVPAQIDREAGVDYRSGSPSDYMSAMEMAGMQQNQNQITDQMGLQPGGGTGLKSDLIDYAKDGSGDVLYNGQNTGIKAEQLNEAQQRLSGNYGSQDHYQKTFGNQEFLLALALGLNSLSTFPNQQWGQYLQGQMENIQKRKNAIDGANWLLSKGRKDLAEAVATGALDFDKAYAEFTKKPESKYRELTAEEYKAMGHDPLKNGRIQIDEISGKLSGFGSKDSVTNINLASKAGEQLNEVFAKTYFENLTKLPSQVQQINTLKSVLDSLESGEVQTGVSKGLLPDWALSIVDPKSLDARNQIASVVQQTLRETLGAQFTEREGENLLRRAWDLRQPTETNIRNTRRLLETAMAFTQERMAQMQYFQTHQDISGYKSEKLSELYNELVSIKNSLIAPLPKDYEDQAGASGDRPKQFKKDGVAFTIEEVD